MLSPKDEAVRGLLTRMIAENGFAPSLEELAQRCHRPARAIEKTLHRLHAAHALLLQPDGRPWIVHPFSLYPSACWVQTPRLGYWATCLYCAFGIAAALDSDAEIFTRIGGEAESVRYRVRGGAVEDSSDIFHFATPPAHWWDNVVHTCASFQPFHQEAQVDDWCARHAMPKGAMLSLPSLWAFASDWYGGYVKQPWRRRSPQAARLLFERHGLVSEFWTM